MESHKFVFSFCGLRCAFSPKKITVNVHVDSDEQYFVWADYGDKKCKTNHFPKKYQKYIRKIQFSFLGSVYFQGQTCYGIGISLFVSVE